MARYGNFDDFHEDQSTGHREWRGEVEPTAADLAVAAADAADAEEAEVWEAHYGTEQERDEALVEPGGGW